MKEIILRPYQLDSIESLRENIREREAGAELMEPRRVRRATPLPTASVRAITKAETNSIRDFMRAWQAISRSSQKYSGGAR